MIKPLRNLVLVKVNKNKELKSESGIILKYQKSEIEDRETLGEVLDFGPDVKDLQIGDKIKFELHAGQDLDENLVILRFESILGVFKD